MPNFDPRNRSEVDAARSGRLGGGYTDPTHDWRTFYQGFKHPVPEGMYRWPDSRFYDGQPVYKDRDVSLSPVAIGSPGGFSSHGGGSGGDHKQPATTSRVNFRFRMERGNNR